MVGSSWLPTICSHCEHLEDAFIELLGPLQLHITPPASLGHHLLPSYSLCLGIFWIFFGRAFLGSPPEEGQTGATLL